MVYRGYQIEKYEGTNIGYSDKPGHHSRKCKGWSLTVEGYERLFDTLKAAKAWLDSYLA